MHVLYSYCLYYMHSCLCNCKLVAMLQCLSLIMCMKEIICLLNRLVDTHLLTNFNFKFFG